MADLEVDLNGTLCKKCDGGRYEETAPNVLACDDCGHKTKRFVPLTPDNCEHVWEWDGQTMMANRWFCVKCSASKIS